MTVAYTRSECTFKTPPFTPLGSVPRPGPTPAREEVIRDLAPPRVQPRTQREWHDIFRGDE